MIAEWPHWLLADVCTATVHHGVSVRPDMAHCIPPTTTGPHACMHGLQLLATRGLEQAVEWYT